MFIIQSENDAVTRIFELMRKNKLTAKQVAEAVGISANNFTEWKKGRSKPGIAALQKIAQYFCVTVEYLTGSESTENAIDIEIKAELNQLADNQKAEILNYIRYVKQK